MKFKLTALCFSITLSVFGQSTYQFLNQPFNARYAMSASNSYIFYQDDEAFISNPSLLDFGRTGQLGVSYTSYLADIKMGSTYYLTQFVDIGKFGFFTQFINYGTFNRADEFGNKTGLFSAYDLVLGSSTLFDLGDSLLLGLTGKFISSSYDTYSSYGVAFDAGFHYFFPSQNIMLGATIKNLGLQLKSYRIKEDLPTLWNIGFSKTLMRLPLTFGAEIMGLNQWFNNKDSFSNHITISGKLKASQNLTIFASSHLGQRHDLDPKSGFDLSGINLGGIISWDAYQFAYAYSDFGVLGGIHRIDFTFNLDSVKF